MRVMLLPLVRTILEGRSCRGRPNGRVRPPFIRRGQDRERWRIAATNFRFETKQEEEEENVILTPPVLDYRSLQYFSFTNVLSVSSNLVVTSYFVMSNHYSAFCFECPLGFCSLVENILNNRICLIEFNETDIQYQTFSVLQFPDMR